MNIIDRKLWLPWAWSSLSVIITLVSSHFIILKLKHYCVIWNSLHLGVNRVMLLWACRYCYLYYNCSLKTGKVPSHWLNAIVTPVPKVSSPTSFSDFRPISVTPHISRLVEKIIVRHWLLPAIPPETLLDQYAFKRVRVSTSRVD